jgi:hypothetical protein
VNRCPFDNKANYKDNRKINISAKLVDIPEASILCCFRPNESYNGTAPVTLCRGVSVCVDVCFGEGEVWGMMPVTADRSIKPCDDVMMWWRSKALPGPNCVLRVLKLGERSEMFAHTVRNACNQWTLSVCRHLSGEPSDGSPRLARPHIALQYLNTGRLKTDQTATTPRKQGAWCVWNVKRLYGVTLSVTRVQN